MNDQINYQNNPLHGLGLQDMLTQLVDHYGFEILDAYLNINCFKTRPTIESSVKFLKKTEWAREKLEVFYLYTYKSLPRPSSEQFALPPRDRLVPDDHKPGEPKVCSFEDAEQQRIKREEKAEAHRQNGGNRKPSGNGGASRSFNASRDRNNNSRDDRKPAPSKNDSSQISSDSSDPWAKWKK
ncbi:VF530 family DNA-binding protein [Marinicellulosiphila megalodicopiae]|uniref:VF530 family protein n=1 Tax=Marinicellulosiphila megalodicopiae TaxID=2724896 RepID=UPI003BB06D36